MTDKIPCCLSLSGQRVEIRHLSSVEDKRFVLR